MAERQRFAVPRTNRERAEVERKRALLHAAHVAPLTELVERLRNSNPDAAVPYFDATDAGIRARILLLLEAPGPRSALEAGSGVVSADNNDQTAENTWRLLRESRIDRAWDLVIWNVIPLYLGDGTKIRPARSSDLSEAKQATLELLSLLPNLQVAVLLGRPAANVVASARH